VTLPFGAASRDEPRVMPLQWHETGDSISAMQPRASLTEGDRDRTIPT
jgi:hypothetical protein